MHRTEIRFLRRLYDAQPHGLAHSSMPRSCAQVVNRLETCGAVELVLAQRGRLIRIKDRSAFDRAVRSMCPEGLFVEMDGLQDRAASVMALGDAKAIPRGACQGVFLRSTKPNVQVSSIDGTRSVPVGKLTQTAGGAAILLEDNDFWTFDGLVVTIENEEAFWRHNLVLPDVDLAIYTHGKMSDRLVSWLSSAPMSGCQYIHWGDYDPMGVVEYCRLAAACPGRVRFHIPEDLDTLLPRYGKPELITKQTDLLASLYDRLGNQVVSRLVGLFENHRRGLEQEALLAHS